MSKILRMPEVEALTGLAKSTIYRDISRNTFPAPVKLGERAVGWVEDQIIEWVDQRISDSKQASVTG